MNLQRLRDVIAVFVMAESGGSFTITARHFCQIYVFWSQGVFMKSVSPPKNVRFPTNNVELASKTSTLPAPGEFYGSLDIGTSTSIELIFTG